VDVDALQFGACPDDHLRRGIQVCGAWIKRRDVRRRRRRRCSKVVFPGRYPVEPELAAAIRRLRTHHVDRTCLSRGNHTQQSDNSISHRLSRRIEDSPGNGSRGQSVGLRRQCRGAGEADQDHGLHRRRYGKPASIAEPVDFPGSCPRVMCLTFTL